MREIDRRAIRSARIESRFTMGCTCYAASLLIGRNTARCYRNVCIAHSLRSLLPRSRGSRFFTRRYAVLGEEDASVREDRARQTAKRGETFAPSIHFLVGEQRKNSPTSLPLRVGVPFTRCRRRENDRVATKLSPSRTRDTDSV